MSITTSQLIAGGLGVLAGIFSRTGKFWWEKRTRTKKLRTALLSEVQTPKKTIESAQESDSGADFEPSHDILPTKVYEEQIDDVGLLCSHEVEHIVDYYSTAEVAEDQLQRIVDDEVDGDHFVNETAEGLKKSRDDAEEALKYHEKYLGCTRYKIRKFYE